MCLATLLLKEVVLVTITFVAIISSTAIMSCLPKNVSNAIQVINQPALTTYPPPFIAVRMHKSVCLSNVYSTYISEYTMQDSTL